MSSFGEAKENGAHMDSPVQISMAQDSGGVELHSSKTPFVSTSSYGSGEYLTLRLEALSDDQARV